MGTLDIFTKEGRVSGLGSVYFLHVWMDAGQVFSYFAV